MSIASYDHQSLTPLRRAIARFSLSETAKYTKLTMGMWIGFALPYGLGFPEAAVALAGSTMLTLALGSSISDARGYFYRRVMSNVVAMPIATLMIWVTAPHLWLGALILPLAIFPIVRLKPSLFQMTSITVPMTLVLYTGEHVPLLEQRLIGVVLGMLLGFIIQHLAFPPDHGYCANTLLNEGNDHATEAIGQLASGQIERAQLKRMTDKLRKSATDLKNADSLLRLDLQLAWISPHLRRHRGRLPLFRYYHELFDSLVNLLETADTFSEQFTPLDPQWRTLYLDNLKVLLDAHKKLAQMANLADAHLPTDEKPLQLDALERIIKALPASNVCSSVYLGHLAGYGLLLCRLSDMQTESVQGTTP